MQLALFVAINMPPKEYYQLRMMNIPNRVGLSLNAKVLLNSFDQYQRGIIDGVELGRQIRLSPNKRNAITEAIGKCATHMRKNPNDLQNCIGIIENCTQLLSIAGRLRMDSFWLPFCR